MFQIYYSRRKSLELHRMWENASGSEKNAIPLTENTRKDCVSGKVNISAFNLTKRV